MATPTNEQERIKLLASQGYELTFIKCAGASPYEMRRGATIRGIDGRSAKALIKNGVFEKMSETTALVTYRLAPQK